MLRNQGMDAVRKWVWIQKIKIFFPAHDLAGKKGGWADRVCWSSCHSWLLNRPQHLRESGFSLTRTDVFLRRVTEWYCANSSSCSFTVHSTPLTQQKQEKLQPVIKGSGAFSYNPICECKTAGNALYLINNKGGSLALNGGRSTPSLINQLHP